MQKFFSLPAHQRASAAAFITLLLLGGVFWGGYRLGAAGTFSVSPRASSTAAAAAAAIGGAPAGVDLGPFWRAWEVINGRFAPPGKKRVTDEEKVWGAIAGLTAALEDPYSVFFRPAELKQFQKTIDGNFEGVGMEIGARDGGIVVIAPLKGTPAESAGVRTGDRIIRIDETDALDLRLDEAVAMIRGPRGTTVKLTVMREGAAEALEIPIERAIIEIPTIETKFEPVADGAGSPGAGGGLRTDGVFVINLFNFSAAAPHQFRSALRRFVESGSDKLLIDLRGNPGGFLEVAVDLTSWFLPAGKVVVREEMANGEAGEVYRSRGYDVFADDLKLVILVNEGSASASEIFAGALREHGVATLVGKKTFGKGSVQELIEITDTTSLKLTIARWLTPNGISISEDGLTPDIVVEITEADRKEGRDPQFKKAIEVLTKG